MLYNPKSKRTSFSCPLEKTIPSSGKHQRKYLACVLQAMWLNPTALSLRGNEISLKQQAPISHLMLTLGPILIIFQLSFLDPFSLLLAKCISLIPMSKLCT